MEKISSKVWLIIFLVVTLGVARPLFAHGPAEPPIVKINGLYATTYPTPQSFQKGMLLPEDAAPDTYLINTPISFEIDLTHISIAPDTTYNWNMGDGTQLHGVKNTHIYTKPGSYFLAITGQNATHPTPFLLHSSLIHVFANPQEKLPEVTILVNGKLVQNPQSEIQTVSYAAPISFAVNVSETEGQEILWDFGDSGTSTETNPQHQYNQTLAGTVYPIVQVKTKTGYIVHNFVHLEKNSSVTAPTTQNKKGVQLIAVGILILGVCLILKKRFS